MSFLNRKGKSTQVSERVTVLQLRGRKSSSKKSSKRGKVYLMQLENWECDIPWQGTSSTDTNLLSTHHKLNQLPNWPQTQFNPPAVPRGLRLKAIIVGPTSTKIMGSGLMRMKGMKALLLRTIICCSLSIQFGRWAHQIDSHLRYLYLSTHQYSCRSSPLSLTTPLKHLWFSAPGPPSPFLSSFVFLKTCFFLLHSPKSLNCFTSLKEGKDSPTCSLDIYGFSCLLNSMDWSRWNHQYGGRVVGADSSTNTWLGDAEPELVCWRSRKLMETCCWITNSTTILSSQSTTTRCNSYKMRFIFKLDDSWPCAKN